MARVTNTLIVLLIITVVTVLLQIFLSRRESRWPGLVLPGISFLFSLIYVLSIAALNQGVGQVIATVLMVLLTGNIPTLVLLAIYAVCREKRRKRAEADTMRIHDL